jgi:ArsR family transcriptional regulator
LSTATFGAPQRLRGVRSSAPLKVSDSTIHRLTDVFRLLADRSRLKIVMALSQQKEVNVSALCAMLQQSQPAVSHHLTLMRMVGLVDRRRDGKHRYYYLASDYLRDLFEQFFSDSGNNNQQLQFEDFALAYRRR